MMPALVPDLPTLHPSPFLTCSSERNIELLQAVISSFVFDYVAKFKIGYLHLSYFIIEECPLVRPERLEAVVRSLSGMALRLGCPSELFAPLWAERAEWFNTKPWRGLWAVTTHERLRLKCILDACMAHTYGLTYEDYQWLLLETDYPRSFLASKKNTKTLDQKRFWRIDKELDPELRHTVLSQVAFHDLQQLGLEEFLGQNDGEGWLVPDELRLADFRLGRDERAHESQPVASCLGPRFLDWQLEEDTELSWQECAAHAELIRRIVPIPFSTERTIGASAIADEDTANYRQGGLF